jgi:hypothetical protein
MFRWPKAAFSQVPIVACNCSVYRDGMSAIQTKSKRSGRRGDPVSLAPLKPDDAIRAIFQIKPDDVKRIVAKRPGTKRSKRHG